MKVKELVEKILIWSICLIVIAGIIFLFHGCAKEFEKAPVITNIKIIEYKHYGGWSESNTKGEIDLDPAYQIKDWSVDYDNKVIVINLKEVGNETEKK